MYLLYADESGDTGLQSSPTNYFLLSSLVVHETRWRDFLNDIVAFRRHLRATKGLKLREEIHAAPFITNPGALVRIRRNGRWLRHGDVGSRREGDGAPVTAVGIGRGGFAEGLNAFADDRLFAARQP